MHMLTKQFFQVAKMKCNHDSSLQPWEVCPLSHGVESFSVQSPGPVCWEGLLLCQLLCSSFLHIFGLWSLVLSIKVHCTVKESTLGWKGGGRKQGGKVKVSGNEELRPKWFVLNQKCLQHILKCVLLSLLLNKNNICII